MSGRCNLTLLNATSSAFQISQSPPKRPYFFCGSKLNEVDSASYLGITVNSKLRWSDYISSISSKASRSLGVIKRNLWNCPRKVHETAYTSIVQPKLEYTSASWDPHYKKDISTLERVHSTAAIVQKIAELFTFMIKAQNFA